jgi:hypothetical protein
MYVPEPLPTYTTVEEYLGGNTQAYQAEGTVGRDASTEPKSTTKFRPL